MDTVITVENLAKKYIIRHEGRAAYKTLRDEIAGTARQIGRLLVGHRPSPGEGTPSREEFWALREVSFEVQQGEKLGVIGRNGAGKSTLLKILSRITAPTRGRIRLRGRVASLLEVGTGFHPELTGKENIYLNGAVLGMTRREIQRKFDEIVAFAEIDKFLDTPVKRYSSGMYIRLAFAVAAHLEPEILLVDEVLAVGDTSFQRKCLGKMEQVAGEGRTILFVSHNMTAIRTLCNRAIFLEAGTKAYDGSPITAVGKYLNRDSENRAVYRWDTGHPPTLPNTQMLEVGLLSDGKSIGPDVSTEKPIQIYIRFRVLNDGAKVGASVLVFNSENQLLVTSVSNHEPDWHMKSRPAGIYRSVCEIPPNLLADGSYSIGIVLWEGFYDSHIVEKDVLLFNAHEEGLVRGDLLHGKITGVIRPLFKWSSAPESESLQQ